MTFAMVLDGLVVVLLVPTIIYAVILNSRLSLLRKNREELGRMISTFNDATVRAESGLPRLKRACEEATKGLRETIERARVLRDDLAYMVERAEEMSNRLERMVRDARRPPPFHDSARPGSTVSPVGLDINDSQTAEDLKVTKDRPAETSREGNRKAGHGAGSGVAAGRSADDEAESPLPSVRKRPRSNRKRAVLGVALANEGGGLRSAGPKRSGADEEGPLVGEEDGRSEAERNLLRALRSPR